MMKFVGIALVAAAAAQEPQLSSENGRLVARSENGMEVERRQTVDGFALSQVVEQQAATISVMQSTLNTFTGAGSPLAMVQGVANDVASRTHDLLVQATTNTQTIAAMSASVVAAASTTSAMSASVATTMASLADDLRDETETALAAVDATISRSVTASQASIRAINASVGTQIAASQTVSMWTGGCTESAYPRNNGWREYCLDQAHVDHTRNKFRVETNRGSYQGFNSQEGIDGKPSRFRALVSGYYSIQLWYIARSHNWSNCRIYVDGAHKTDGHYRTASWPEWGNNWKDVHSKLVWPISANKMFWAKIYAHPGHWTAYHSTNTGGSHSRMTVVYDAGSW